jgi:hypothetical protein
MERADVVKAIEIRFAMVLSGYMHPPRLSVPETTSFAGGSELAHRHGSHA